MPLSDNRMKSICPDIISPYKESNVSNICYDLTTNAFCISPGNEQKEIELNPGDSVFVQTEECIKLPNDITAEVHLRNRRIRQGLSLDAPVYQPGHYTRVFFRVTNVSRQQIHLDSETGLASLMFEPITGHVDHPYDGGFQDEIDYRGLGKYSSELSKDIRDIDGKIDSIKNIERNVYANVLSIMAIFVGIFTLININITAAMHKADIKMLLSLNLTTIGSVGFLVAMINTIIPDGKHKRTAWAACVLAYVAAVILQFILK